MVSSGEHDYRNFCKLDPNVTIYGFDKVLAAVPYKGQVLNSLAAWWFEETKDIVPNHMLETPDPSVIG